MVFLLIFAVLLFGIVVWSISRGKKRSIKKENIADFSSEYTGKNSKVEPIKCGNISIMFDREMNVYIIPYVKDLSGMGKPADKPKKISNPYSKELLGNEIRKGMKACEKNIPCSDAEFMRSLGARGWKEFSEGKRSISIHYRESYGVIFNTTRRRVDGSYQFNKFGFEEVIRNDVSDKEIGETVLKLLQRCK